MRFSRIVKMAASSILANKMRSFLTMLGIIIGISSVIVLVGMGQGTKESVSSEISSLGTNLITVNIMTGRNGGISDSDISKLKKEPGIKDIAPSISESNVTIRSEISSSNNTTTVEGCIPSSATIRKLSVSSGRFITQDDVDNRYRVAVVGTDVADELYGTTDIVGESINVDGSNFTIVGVLTTKGSSGMDSQDDKIIIPSSTAMRMFKISKVRSFYVEAADENSVSEAEAYLKLYLDNHIKKSSSSSSNSAYRIMDQTSLLETATSTSDSMSAMLAGVASISLLVGGIGIMNIMLVSVIERTREIGIRKAIGAKRRTILIQFLLESAGISSIGGILGVLGGYFAAYIAKTFFSTSVVISQNVVVGSFLFSIIVGVVFGVYPANKASKLSPIEALRFE